MEKSVLLISGIYPPDTGGPATFIHDFSNWLSNQKIRSTLITYTDGPSRTMIDGSIKIVYCHRYRSVTKRYFCFVWSILKNYKTSMNVLVAGAFLETLAASIARNINYTVKIPGDIVWERARNSKITDLDILAFQNSKPNLPYRMFRALFTLSIFRAKNVIVPSLFLQRLVSGWVKNKKNISLIYNSIDISSFTQTFETVKKFDVLTACRLVPWKGVDELIESCSELNLSLGIAGEGPDQVRLKNLASSLGASVTFLGQVPKDQLSNLYSSSNVFVLNSYYEGLPHVLVEAKASGLFCIGRAGTGSEEVINDMVDGMLASEKAGHHLKDLLRKVFSNATLIDRLRLKARQDVINRFDQENNFQEIYEVLART